MLFVNPLSLHNFKIRILKCFCKYVSISKTKGKISSLCPFKAKNCSNNTVGDIKEIMSHFLDTPCTITVI